MSVIPQILGRGYPVWLPEHCASCYVSFVQLMPCDLGHINGHSRSSSQTMPASMAAQTPDQLFTRDTLVQAPW